MFDRRGRWLSVSFAVVLAGALLVAAVALGSQTSPPLIKSPRAGARVHTGKVRIVVQATGLVGNERPVYVSIAPTKKLVRQLSALLSAPHCGLKCDYVSLHPWKGHPGKWIVIAKAPRDGWTTIPGKYFMQAEHVAPASRCAINHCEITSRIRGFRVVR